METEKKYYAITPEQKERARNTDLVSFLRARGEEVKRSGSEYVWKDGTQTVSIRGSVWFHQYEREGGDAIGFVRKFYDKSFSEAVAFLLGENMSYPVCQQAITNPRKELTLPERNYSMFRVAGYLQNRRGLDPEVIKEFASCGMIYESSQYHNAVFVGFDADHNPRHANLRGLGENNPFKKNAPGSDPAYSFHWIGTSNKLFVFEAPIDLMSYICMNPDRWREHSYAACCGVSDKVVYQMLKDYPNINQVYLCLDNDEPGQAAALRIAEGLRKENCTTTILVPERKDWNEDLLADDCVEEDTCQGLVL